MRIFGWLTAMLLAPRAALACDAPVLAALGVPPEELISCEEVTRVGPTVFALVHTRLQGHPSFHLLDATVSLSTLTDGKLVDSREIGYSGPFQGINGGLLAYPLPLFHVDGWKRSDGESSYRSEEIYLLTDTGPSLIFSEKIETDSGSGYPTYHGDFELTLTTSALGQAPDLHIRKTWEICPDPEADCTDHKEEWRVCFYPPDRWARAERCPRKPSARATSALPPTRTNRYDPERAIDGDPSTAWVEAEKGPGIGAKLHIDLGPMDLNSLEVLPGYGKSDAIWARNNRLQTAWIHLSDGARIEAHFADERSLQTVWLGNHQAIEWVEIEIRGVYPGSRDDDTCISEVIVGR